MVSAALRDFAWVQSSTQSRWGYKRAAAAVRQLERPLPDVLDAGILPRIHGIGPASTRIILEVLEHGFSPTVEHAIAASGQQHEIARRRALRTGFLSRAEVVRIIAIDVPSMVNVEDYRGDCQMHSVWSDGLETIAQMAEGAMARGWNRIAMTDHSKGLAIAGGMSIETMRRQHDEINALNHTFEGRFRVLKGVEANIFTDGTLDLKGEELAGVEMLLAAPHSKLRLLDDQTDRMLAAVRTPGVHVLAHPRGRMSDSRPGITADWDRVFEEAAARGVAIEIDGDPARQDLDYQLADRAREGGCLFALDSDAHDTQAFIYTDTAIAHARLAGIPASRVINCWDLPRLLGWLDDHRG
ncbi:MAG: PHP domain-containing protein [Acidobacteria bacterium]|nr:PHP domain-containing protein [Acidobacteriota bacterium]